MFLAHRLYAKLLGLISHSHPYSNHPRLYKAVESLVIFFIGKLIIIRIKTRFLETGGH